jgi:hypothetical protein
MGRVMGRYCAAALAAAFAALALAAPAEAKAKPETPAAEAPPPAPPAPAAADVAQPPSAVPSTPGGGRATSPEEASEPAAGPKAAEGDLVFTQGYSLYYEGQKIGYRTISLSRLPEGRVRLETNTFLRRAMREERPSYYKRITAEMDAAGRPLALDCRVKSAEREWQVTGRAEGGEFRMTRQAGKAQASAAVSLEDDVTFLSCALVATVRSKPKEGQTRRWMVIDESLGALLPQPCLVQVAGRRTIMAGDGRTLTGTAVLWACGPEQIGCLVDDEGRALRLVWQSSAMAAAAASFAEARQMNGAAAEAGPRGVTVEGLQGSRFTSARAGYAFTVPPYPCILQASKENGVAAVEDLTEETEVLVRPAIPNSPLRADAMSEEDWARVTSLLQQQWAAGYEDVQAEPPLVVRVASGEARAVDGTARLGCAPIHFRNVVVVGDGIAYLVSVTSADRPLIDVLPLRDRVVASLAISAVEGRLTIATRGDRFESANYGFEVRRPGKDWQVPTSRDGPATALELVRKDLAAVAIVRVLAPRPGQDLAAFVAEQANRAADAPGVEEPKPQPAELGGRKALELRYAGDLLGGQAAQCTAVYAELGSRIFSLILMARADADKSVWKELDAVRKSVKFTKAEASK